MGFKDKFKQQYAQTYMNKYGDRLTQVQGKVLSIKVEEKAILWIFHKLLATIVVKPEGSKSITKCVYKKNRWFKKVTFISVLQGHNVVIQGLKGKKGKDNRENIEIMNIRNLTTKRDLVPVEGAPKVQRVRQDRRYR
ncbi:hypothetical protein SAMN02745196_00379 [Clostridium collagenovorans DSM 3089]|uniref:Uncharacterized protein n=1 Tax=Clostridium collagenovorans DSM 3089 TaxID=1121306 RepID=A0A1M5SZQ6_9CLOT|nr:hypothetical protein [Clostridium collagenovorans]SHH43955.1 hypothetical protein SAMN02745196_00379 [Clostridium collagenovorans DSM 3089]